MTQLIWDREFVDTQELQFPIQLKLMTKEETKEYHLKKLYELPLKSLGEIPQLEEKTWQRRFIGMYFTKELKKQMALSDRTIEDEGVENSS